MHVCEKDAAVTIASVVVKVLVRRKMIQQKPNDSQITEGVTHTHTRVHMHTHTHTHQLIPVWSGVLSSTWWLYEEGTK